MAPHLVRWQESYAAQGFTVLYVADGRRDSASAAHARIRDEGVNYPIFMDANATATQTYGVRAFPTAYILDRSGTVVWEGVPVYNPAAVERAIQAALTP